MFRKSPAPVATSATAPPPAAQDWLPIRDLHDGCLIRPDGGVVGGLTIAPFSLQLKSAREVENLVRAFQAALNGLTVPWQVLSIGRPMDLDAYLESLDRQLMESDPRRKPLLREYLRWVSNMVRSGSTVERRYYLLLTRHGPDAVSEHREHLRAVAEDLARISTGFRSMPMTDADWRELLFLAFHADQSSIERVPTDRVGIPSRYEGGAS